MSAQQFRRSFLRKFSKTLKVKRDALPDGHIIIPTDAVSYPMFVHRNFDKISARLRLRGERPSLVLEKLTQQWFMLPRASRVSYGRGF